VSNTCMKRRISFVIIATLLTAMPLRAQQEPAVIISIASVKDTMGDIQYAAKAAGVPQGAAMLQFLAAQYTQLLEPNSPLGVALTFNGGPIPEVLGFVPARDFDALRQKIAEQASPPNDVGGGIWQVEGQPPIFLKQEGKFCFISIDPNAFANLPKDPTALLEGLDKKHNIGVRAYIQRIPDDLRQQFIGLMTQNMQQQMNNDSGNEGQAVLQKAMAEASLKNMTMLAEEGDKFEMGLAIDEEQKVIRLEYSLTALPQSALAEELSYIQDAETEFGPLIDPNAAISFNLSSKLGKTQAAMGKDLLKMFRTSIEKEMNQEGQFPTEEAKAAAQRVVSNLIDVANATIDSGKVDSVGSVSLDGTNLQFAAAAHIADGEKLNATIREIVQLAKDEPDFPGATLDAAKVGNVSIHLMSVPVPDDEEQAQAIFGESVEIAVGVGPNAAFLCIGKDAVGRMKDLASASGTKAVKPMLMRASVGQLIKFGSQFDGGSEIQQLLGAVDEMGDRDHVEVVVDAIPNGAKYQLRIEDGILKLIGIGVQQAMGGGGGF
jgi:hypothetical protein